MDSLQVKIMPNLSKYMCTPIFDGSHLWLSSKLAPTIWFAFLSFLSCHRSLYTFHPPRSWQFRQYVLVISAARTRCPCAHREQLTQPPCTGDRQKRVRVMRHLQLAFWMRIEFVLGSGWMQEVTAFTDSVSTGLRRAASKMLPTTNISSCIVQVSWRGSFKRKLIV